MKYLPGTINISSQKGQLIRQLEKGNELEMEIVGIAGLGCKLFK